MTHAYEKNREWTFDGLVPATAQDVNNSKDLIRYWEASAEKYPEAAGPKPAELKEGEPIAHITLPNGYRRMPASSIKEFYEAAVSDPAYKSHQIPALTQAAQKMGLIPS